MQAIPCIKKHTSGGSQQEDEDMVKADMDREEPFMVIHASLRMKETEWQ